MLKWLTRSFDLGRILGFPLRLHVSVLLIFVFISYRLMVTFGAPLWTLTIYPLLLICILLHELGHAVVGRGFGCEVIDIRLNLLGGLARFKSLPKQPRRELAVALAGPVVSLTLAGIFYFLQQGLLQSQPETLFSMPRNSVNQWTSPRLLLHVLALANLLYFLFNLLPAFPMDGGRVLRALLAMRMDHLNATRIAVRVSSVMALGMIAAGFLVPGLGPIWMILIAGFVFFSSQFELRMLQFKHATRRHARDPEPEKETENVGLVIGPPPYEE